MIPSSAKYLFPLLAWLLAGPSPAQDAPSLNAARATRSVLWEQYGGLYRIYEPQLLTRFRALDLTGDADQDGDIDLQDYFFAADALASEDPYFDFNANGAVDMLDLLEIHNNYGQKRQGPFLALNPKGLALGDLHIADGATPGSIRLEFTTGPMAGHITPIVFVLPQRPAALSALDPQYQWTAVEHRQRDQTHTLDIDAPADGDLRYIAFGYRAGRSVSQVLVFAWHFGADYRALADLKSFRLHPSVDAGYKGPADPAITDFAVTAAADGQYEILLEANRFRFDARFWIAAATESAATVERDGRAVEILASEGLSFTRRYRLALPEGEWVLHGALLTRGGAIDDLATASVRVAGANRIANNESLSFADPQLEAAVRAAVRRPFGALYRADIADLDRLDASGLGIRNLDGIEALASLRVLDLSDNAIDDIAPLADLRHLISLHLRQNRVVDLAPLQHLADLDGIDLADNPITDLGPLVANAALKVNDTVDLRGNALSEHAIAVQIPALMGRRVFVLHRRAHRAPTPARPDRTVVEEAQVVVEEIVDDGPQSLAFADPQFEAAVRDAIGKPLGAIFPADVADLTSLDARNRDIADLGGVEQLIALESLKLNQNQIRDVTPLATLAQLTTLHLNRNEITDINPLGAIDPLSELEVAGNQISDITVLARLRSFTKLALNDNQVSDLAPLADLVELESLQLNNNLIADIAPLRNLTALRSLQLNNNQIADISPLADLTGIRELSLVENQIADLGPVAQMRELTILSIDKNRIADLNALVGKTRLVLLEAADNRISDLTPLQNLNGLQVLALGKNQIRSLAPLQNLNGLSRILAADNQIADIAALANKAALFRIELDNNQISDISALATLPALDHITLDNNQITHIAALANNPGLQPGSIVFIAGNPIDPEINAAALTALQDRRIALQF